MRRLAWLPLALLFATSAIAQDSVEQRLYSDRIGYIAPGTYLAGDRVEFTLNPLGPNYLMRISGSPEVFVLYEDRASMGGRVLKYDSGETAVSVSGWGGMTLYVSSAPGGLPAERTGDSPLPAPTALSVGEIQSASSDEAQRLSYTRRLNLSFTMNWSSLAEDSSARLYAYDSMENTARGLDRFTASKAGHDAIGRHVDTIAFAEAGRPTITLNGRTLVVTFNPARGYVGRASSRAIARALAAMFSVPLPPG